MANAAERLAREIAELKRRIAGLERSAATDLRSIDDGTFTAYDDSGEEIVVLGRQPDGSYGVQGVNGGQVVADAARRNAITAEAILDGAVGPEKASFYGEIADATQAAADAEAAASQASSDAAAAQALATQAAQDADDAEQRALEALGVANEKADIVYSTTAPAGDANVFWVDTTTGRGNRWDGSQWVEIQDEDVQTALANASAANSAASDAQDAADAAAQAAQAAQTTADNAASAAAAADAKADAAQAAADAAQADANAAQTAADDAEQAALDALGVANSKADIVYQATAPTGDPNVYWVDTDTGRGHRWDGSQWLVIQDEDVQTALSEAAAADQAAQAAQSDADAAAQAASQASADAAAAASAASAAQSRADEAYALADGKVQTYFGTQDPTTISGQTVGTGDLWIDEGNGNVLKRWNGSGWDVVQDQEITQALQAAADAEAAADGKITTFVGDTAPTAEGIGDMWVDTANGNRLNRWNGSSWVPLTIGSDAIADEAITETKISDNAVTAPKVRANTIIADRLTVGARGTSILTNGSMEDPGVTDGVTDWNAFGGWNVNLVEGGGGTLTENRVTPLSGTRSAHISLVDQNAGVYLAQDKEQPVTGGQQWHMSALVRLSRSVDKSLVADENLVSIIAMTAQGDAYDPTDTPDGVNVIWSTVDSREDAIGGTVLELDGTFTVPAGHTKMVVAVLADAARDGSGYEVDIDEVYTYPEVNEVSIVGPDGSVTASINSDGSAAFHDIEWTGTLRGTLPDVVLDGQPLNERLDEFPRGVVAYGHRVPAVSGITSEYGVMEFSWLSPSDATSRLLRLGVQASFSPDMNNDGQNHGMFRVRVHYESAPAGTVPPEPDLNSPLIWTAHLPVVRQTPTDLLYYRIFKAEVANDTEYRFLVTYQASTGMNVLDTVGDVQAWVEDLGLDAGNSADKNTGGGSLGSGGSDTGDDPEPTPKTYTKTFYATWSSGYNGSGNRIDMNASHTQGYYSGTNGNTMAAIGFDDGHIRNVLRGSDVQKVELYLYFNHWYYNSGGTAVIGKHSSTTNEPNFYNLSGWNTDEKRSGNWPKPGGRWVDVTSMGTGANAWRDGTIRGYVLGPGPTTSKKFYGAFNGNDKGNQPKVRITYRK